MLEALVGAFLVDSGFKGATAFLKWIGIPIDFEESQVHKIFTESKNYLLLANQMDITALENLLEYKFKHKGLLIQAFVHPSYDEHLGGCYQVSIGFYQLLVKPCSNLSVKYSHVF